MLRGNDKQNIFDEEVAILQFERYLAEGLEQHGHRLHAYCWMGNHVHLLLQSGKQPLSGMMQVLSQRYTQWYNRHHDRVGHLFQGRYKSFVVQRELYFFACSRYIDLNPVNALMVKEAKDYAYSGYASLSLGKKGLLKLDDNPLYDDLGKSPQERQIAYRALVHALSLQGGELDLLNRRAGILGDAEFKEKVRGER